MSSTPTVRDDQHPPCSGPMHTSFLKHLDFLADLGVPNHCIGLNALIYSGRGLTVAQASGSVNFSRSSMSP